MSTDNDKPKKHTFPSLGLAGAGFATVLEIANTKPFSEEAKTAAMVFAMGIPLALCSHAIDMVVEDSHFNSKVKSAIGELSVALWMVAQIVCFIGCYWLFRHISPEAAEYFIWAAVLGYLLPSLILWIRDALAPKPPNDPPTNTTAL